MHPKLKLSLLKIGLAITIIGIVWSFIVFSDAQRTIQDITLETNHSKEIELGFTGFGIGYYKIFLPEFSGNGVFVQILDSKHNVISEKMIETKLSVNYFDFDQGEHTVKISNLSNQKIPLEVEFGSTNSENMTMPGGIVIAGITVLLVGSYIRMKNYKMAQPDENIS